MSNLDLIPLTRLAREFAAGGFTDQPVNYAQVYRAVVSGAIPAEQAVSGRWGVRRADLSAAATALGLTPAPKTGKPGRPRRSSATIEHAVA